MPRHFTFLLMPDFSMMAFTSAVEPLRAANRWQGEDAYSWNTASVDGQPVRASNGVTVMPDSNLAGIGKTDAIVVCAGLNAYAHIDKSTFGPLRKAASNGVMLGGLCTGSVLLASAGLLDGFRCTIHWEDTESFSENFPHLEVTTWLFEIDRGRFTCSGGTAPLDLMIYFIGLDFGHDLAVSVADQMLHHATRKAGVPQRLSLPQRTGVRHPGVLDAIAQMEMNLEEPLALQVIASRVGMTVRHLERLFSTLLGTSPTRYYRNLRLSKARHLVLQTGMPLTEIAAACGFTSTAHFARVYRSNFATSPTDDRKTARD